MKFKNVVTYYLDGKPNGVRRCRIEGSVIEALVIPREAVKDAKALADVLPKHGIYFLIEDKEPSVFFPPDDGQKLCGPSPAVFRTAGERFLSAGGKAL